jgi:probable HAF family extracellular repeat protein
MNSILRTRWPGLLTAVVLLLGSLAAPLRASSPTPAGTNVTVTENGVTLTFSNVTTAGETTVTPIDPNSLTGVPGGYVVNGDSLAFDVETTAAYTGPVTASFEAPGIGNALAFGALRVLRDESAPGFVDRTVLAPDTPAPDFATRTVSARVTSLSPFLLAERTAGSPAPTTCYSVTQLRIGGFAATGAFAFTRSGDVLGSMGYRTFFYDHNTGMRDLTALLGPGGSVGFNDPQKAVSEEGSVLGQGTDGSSPDQYAVLFDGAGAHKLLLGGTSSTPVDINDAGQAIGAAATAAGETHAFRYDHGTMTDLGTLGGTQSFPHAISENGNVAGDATTAASQQHAFLYDGTGMHDLGVLPGGTWSIGSAVNDAGQVAGIAEAAGGGYHAFLFDGATMLDLGVLPGDTNSEALRVNAAGQVVGTSIGGPDGVQHVFLYDGSSMIDLTPPGAVYAEILGFADNGLVVLKAHTGYNSDAGAVFVYDGTSLQAVSLGGTTTISRGPGPSLSPVVNASGAVAGASDITGDASRHAFLYDGTGLHDLNAVVGGSGYANGINAAGQVVGSENGNAFLYTGGVLANLNDLTCGAGIKLSSADGISDSGTILAGVYLLTPTSNPVPPPTSYPPQPPVPTDPFPGPPATATGRIAFERGGRIWIMNADGTGQTPLTSGFGGSDNNFVWSPDGTRGAFLRGGGLFLVNADGSNQHQLGASISRPAWSPDGTKIAVSNQSDTTSQIAVINADGTGGTTLTNTVADSPDSSPAWSPDGTKIAFVSGRDGNAEIYVMNADGTGQTNLTHSLGRDYSPAWSPDGSKIVFVHEYQIYVMNADGSNKINLSHSDDPNYGPIWSPDGTRIAYYRVILNGPEDDAAVFVVNPDGSGAQQISLNSSYDTVPDWSPAGDHLVVQNFRPEGNSEIYLINSDGTGPRNLTNNGAYDANPRWQPPPPPNTPAGTNVTVTLNGVTVVFSHVTSAGTTLATPVAPNSLSGVPAEYLINADSLAYTIQTDAVYDGPVTVSFYVPGVGSVPFTALRALHDEPPPAPHFVDRTIQAPDSPAPNFATHTISARVSSLGTFLVTRYRDKTDPVTTATLSTPANAAGWNKTDVTVTLTASDGPYGSGVASITYSATGAQVIAQTTVAGNTVTIPVTTDGVTTLHFQATDNAVNVEASRTLQVKIDRTAPTITITRPAVKTYTVNQSVLAAFNCSDTGGSGIASCTGTAASGAAIDTASAGTRTFTVNALDLADNAASQSVTYQVSYAIQPLYDETQAFRIGTTIPIKLQIVDVVGTNLSAPGTVVTALAVTRKSDGAPVSFPGAGSPFSFDTTFSGYVYNLSTTGYAAGTYLLSFSAGNDPVPHTVQFKVK